MTDGNTLAIVIGSIGGVLVLWVLSYLFCRRFLNGRNKDESNS